MRKLIEGAVIYNFGKGLDELGLYSINYARNRANVPALIHTKEDREGYAVVSDISALVKEFTDEELLVAFEEQMCLKYR